MTESPITRVTVCVGEPVARGGDDIVRKLDWNVARERYWRARVDEWAAEVPLSDEVRDDALAQLKALGWPEIAEIEYELESTSENPKSTTVVDKLMRLSKMRRLSMPTNPCQCKPSRTSCT